MLTDLGVPLVRWLDDELLPDARRSLLDAYRLLDGGLWAARRYVHRWRVLLDT